MRLIDADALIEKFNEKVDMAECLIDARTAERFATFCALADAVEEMPTADVAPVQHERWKKHGSKWQCTGCKVLMSIDGTPQENLLYYCPNCGAKMDKEEE